MKAFIGILFIAFSLSNIALSQEFPATPCEDLNQKTVNVPEEFKGTKTILFLAFTAEAENQLSRWYGPVYMMFLDESGFNAMAYECDVKLMMMFTGAAQSAANKVIESIKSNADPSMTDFLLFYKGDYSDEMKTLGLKKKDDCYVIVLDEKGKIILQEQGNYSETKLDRIAELVEL